MARTGTCSVREWTIPCSRSPCGTIGSWPGDGSRTRMARMRGASRSGTAPPGRASARAFRSAWKAIPAVGVICLLPFGTDLMAGGSFSKAGGNWANCVARWDGSSWNAIGGADQDVIALVVMGGRPHPGRRIHLGGRNHGPSHRAVGDLAHIALPLEIKSLAP